MSATPFNGLIKTIDTGYTKVCAHCSRRYGEAAHLVGKPRTLELVKCLPCINKPKKDTYIDKNKLAGF